MSESLGAQLLEALVFADGDVFHLRGDDALAGIPELGDGMAGGGAERLAAGGGRETGEAVAIRRLARVGSWASER